VWPALERSCLRAMALLPGQRHGTVAEVAGELRSWLGHGQPAGAGFAAQWRLLRRQYPQAVARRRWLAAGVVAVLLLAVVAAVYWRYQTLETARLERQRNARLNGRNAELEDRVAALETTLSRVRGVSKPIAAEWVGEATRQLARERWAAAERTLEGALVVAPGMGLAWYHLGRAQLAQGELHKADEAFAQAIEYGAPLKSRKLRGAVAEALADGPPDPAAREALLGALREAGEGEIAAALSAHWR